MEEYPEELRTPPVRLISLVGCPELQATISTHLLSEQPPIHTLAFPDLSNIPLPLLHPPPPKDSASIPPTPSGILNKDWLVKHRTKIPSVLAALFSADHVNGDPAQWLRLCSELDNLKVMTRTRNIKLVVIVVHSNSKDGINEDRITALRKRAEVDSKYFVFFNSNDTSEIKNSLNRLGNTFSELSDAYYRDEGRRIKLRIEKKNFTSIELNVRYCFKVAVYAEFLRDWVEALRFYEDGYNTLREMVGTSTRLPAIQRLVEIKAVAEQLYFKISTLLLHSGKVVEAVTWFRQHNASYRRLTGAPESIFLHWEWMSRQFLVFAELLETSSAIIQGLSSLALSSGNIPLTEWELRPGYYYQLAAHYLKEKRLSFELILSMPNTAKEMDKSVESVVPSDYVGQFARLLEQGKALVMQPLTDEEYICYAIAEGKRFQDSFEIIALLKKSCESYNIVKAERMRSFCELQMAREYYAVGDFKIAKQVFDGIVTLYRQEGWVTLLWEVLDYLRECSRKQGIVKDFIEYSLEMAALPISSSSGVKTLGLKVSCPTGPVALTQREMIHKEVFELIGGELGLVSTENGNDLKITGDNPINLEIDLVSPLRLVLLASAAFHEQIIKPGVSTLISVSLLSQLPLTIDIDQLEVQFNQPICNFRVVNAERLPPAGTGDDQQGGRIESVPSLSLAMNKWLRLTYEMKTAQSGKLECTSVIAKLGPQFTICCRAESPASMDELHLWKFEDRVETLPTKDPYLAFSGQKATQVEEPEPEVDLSLGATGPALVGECFIVPVTIASKGDLVYSGELKINLVDVKGGGLFSPREAESISLESHHVELLSVSGIEEVNNSSHLESNKIKKIQPSFGLVSVPFLNTGDSWSCNLEIKWHRPKPVMLFVSLTYSPNSNESNAQKVHVHKNLQIEGKTAFSISHCFKLPFQRDPLLISRVKAALGSDASLSLPQNESSILTVSAKNCTEVPLQLLSMSIEADDDGVGSSCTVRHAGEDLLAVALVPGEEFKKIFTVIPKMNSTRLRLGSVCLRWRRVERAVEPSNHAVDSVLSKEKPPDIDLELSPLVVSFERPPFAVLRDPFTYFIKLKNQTKLLQEVKFSLADAQGFVLSGPHNDTVFVLPESEHILSYKLVPLSSGMQQLPRLTLTSVRYSAGFQPSISASTIFVFPSKPHFEERDVGVRGPESLAVE